MNCQKEKNLQSCPCTYLPAEEAGPGCPRKGICCECLRHHLQNQELPACLPAGVAGCFSPEAEKTYDRSIEKFIKDQK